MYKQLPEVIVFFFSENLDQTRMVKDDSVQQLSSAGVAA